jgi:hypothetical protein
VAVVARLAPLLAAGLLAACATHPPPPDATVPVAVASTLVHGADSTGQVDDQRHRFATSCLQGPPAFWGRYFNHSDLPERDNRLELSFAAASEPQLFQRQRLRLLPIFAQNLNDIGADEGRVHGAANARDLIAAVGAQRLVRHLAARPLYVVLNEETPSGVLALDHYRGWVGGLAQGLAAIGADARNLRPVVYGNINAEPELAEVVRQLHANRFIVPYAGFWRARRDANLQTRTPPEHCGRLADWADGTWDWDENVLGPLLMRQYVLDAQGPGGASIDLNALNPAYAAQLLDGMISFGD